MPLLWNVRPIGSTISLTRSIVGVLAIPSISHFSSEIALTTICEKDFSIYSIMVRMPKLSALGVARFISNLLRVLCL